MSGVKCNKNVRTVRKINTAAAAVLFNHIQSRIESRYRKIEVLNTKLEENKPVLSSKSLKSELNVLNKLTNSADTVRKEALNTAQRVMSLAFTESAKSAENIQSKLDLISRSHSIKEIKTVYNEIASEVVHENSKVFNKSVVEIVKTAMIENGFSTIKHKIIGTTPVLICKNSKGQTLRNEVTTDVDGKTSIIRKQFGILKSECDALNEKINASLAKHGLEYESFEVIEQTKETFNHRNFNFSTTEKDNQNNNELKINQNGNQ